MSTSDLQATVFFGDCRAESLTNDMTDNSMDLRLAQKQASNEIDMVHANYAPEKEAIRNEIEGLDKNEQREEYQDLMTELNDKKEEEEQKVEKIENELNEYETQIQSENEMLEVQLENVQTQTESFKEMLKQNIEDKFSYFQ